MKKNTRSFIRKSLCGASALAIASSMMVVPAFADVGGEEMDTSGYVTCSAYAAATPAPEILGLTNMGWRSIDGTIGDLDWNTPAFRIWGTSINSSPNPYYWNAVIRHAAGDSSNVDSNGSLATVVAYDRTSRSPSAAMKDYESSDDNGKLVWQTEPDIILGTQGLANGASYTDSAYAGAVSAVTGDTSYSPVGLNFTLSTNATILDSLYNLADAGDKVAAANSNKKLRYGSATNIAKEMEEYYRGSQGYILKQLAKDNKSKKTFYVPSAYDAGTGMWTVNKTGSVGGSTSSDRTIETAQYVATNLAGSYDPDNKSAEETMQVSTAQLKQADYILVGTQTSDTASYNTIVNALKSNGLASKSYWDNQMDGHPGATFGTTHNSPENVQNYGRILGFMYPEYLDQDDMICYYFDHFYHIADGQLATVIDQAMDGVRNYDDTGSEYTDWTTRDASTYNSSNVQSILKEGLAYLKANESDDDIPSILHVTDNYGTVDMSTMHAIDGATVSSISAQTYTGKAIEPSVTVSLNGQAFSNSNYTVSYSDNKNVGEATVTVKGKGDYYGSVSQTFTINPKGTSLSKVAAQKKGFKATWKKQSAQTDGFQVRYSTKSNMKSAKSKTVSGKSKTSTTVKSLKKGKKYYVQVRSYKKASGKTYYSSWSGKKSVKTK